MTGAAAEDVRRRDAGEAPRRERTLNWAAAAAAAGGGGVARKNRRIVRAAEVAPGGKDRHSKVATAQGLRDRRVRLLVPTAVRLYNLQDRLGLAQTSKAVDWLLHAARHAIDVLPPLPALPPAASAAAGQLPAAACDDDGIGKAEHQRLDEEEDQWCHYGQWDPVNNIAGHASCTGGGHFLQPPASWSASASMFEPAFDSKVMQHGCFDGALRGFVTSSQEY